MSTGDSKLVGIEAGGDRDEAATRVRFSPLRTGVPNRLMLVAVLSAILWTAIAMVITS
jgi:hypothetical protein